MGFFEVTGVRALFFRNVSMGETADPDKSGQCGGDKPARHREPLRRGGRDSPVDMLLKKPAWEPRPPAHRAYAPEGTEEKLILDTKIWVMQRSLLIIF